MKRESLDHIYMWKYMTFHMFSLVFVWFVALFSTFLFGYIIWSYANLQLICHYFTSQFGECRRISHDEKLRSLQKARQFWRVSTTNTEFFFRRMKKFLCYSWVFAKAEVMVVHSNYFNEHNSFIYSSGNQ